ncbi:putative Fe-Mo cluster-binding NifX family protein [Methanomicrobium sp. W14]|uniref:NifB/NifX family molybdenum-iron cluster-binding protein n=1 Tax=Methanomicrobium sp. W14 TaxID=2817839 RepID=UPI001AE74F6A|nr:NifB/NifX family molybdenum-iron cluster-binding protein [Methanomicrobium sp. W14]MBP2132332.1 putative Fe-Mo cluster-binding NifX family protein [Methanomicrobium sp. W14]
MKIAVAKEDENVAEHFGHCTEYAFFDVEDGKIAGREDLKSPEHAPGVIPKFLKENGADVVLACGIGQGALDLFSEMGIKVYIGVQGSIDSAIKSYLDGTLTSGSNFCDH